MPPSEMARSTSATSSPAVSGGRGGRIAAAAEAIAVANNGIRPDRRADSTGVRAGTPDAASLRAGMRSAPPGYELLDELGQGATGTVHLARHVALGREVAIKRIV